MQQKQEEQFSFQSVFSHHKLTTTAFVETHNTWAGLKPGSAAPAQNQVLQSDRARLMHTTQHIQVYPGDSADTPSPRLSAVVVIWNHI